MAVQGLMAAVETELTARLGKPEEAAKFSRQHLANTLWALATLELLPSGRLLEAFAEAMKERASDCNPQEISNTVWAFAKLGEPRASTVSALCLLGCAKAQLLLTFCQCIYVRVGLIGCLIGCRCTAVVAWAMISLVTG